jgi:hypothetical protein
MNTQNLLNKWRPLIEHESLPTIKDKYRRGVLAQILENQETALEEERSQMSFLTEAPSGNVTSTANVSNWDPVLISLVRRAMPNLIAYDVAGVQPMSGPTGLIFAMRSDYRSDSAGASIGDEALFNEALTGFSGNKVAQSGDPSSLPDTDTAGDLDGTVASDFAYGEGATTPVGEALGTDADYAEVFNEMGFRIEKATVTAKTRALKAKYTVELAQDLKKIHGLDAETELANILSTEILAEINRELIRTINVKAKLGSQQNDITNKGIFSLDNDSDGRWSVEKYKGLLVQLDREANVIAKETRRGKGNFIICSSDVATALAASGMLDYAPALSTELEVDDTGNTFAGILNGRIKVYIDPYALSNYVTVGYRGTNPYDAGMFYCPYVPLTMARTIGEEDFQPRIGFKTRYGMVANPFVGSVPGDDTGANRSNQYFRTFRVDSILGKSA